MILVDANLLLYAYNPSASQHSRAREWLEHAVAAPEAVGLSWATVLAFIRIGTNPRAFPAPLAIGEAVDIVSEWLDSQGVQLVEPTERHWDILGSILRAAQAKGPLVPDAHLAALAIEHGALLCSTDRDFTRFPGLRHSNPIA